MKKIITIISLFIVIFSSTLNAQVLTGLNLTNSSLNDVEGLSSPFDEDWSIALDNDTFLVEDNLNTTLKLYSNQAKNDPADTVFSSGWKQDPDTPDYMILDDMGEGVIGENVRYNNLQFGGVFTPTKNIDILFTIEDVTLANNMTPLYPYEIEMSKSIGGLTTNNYTKVDFNVQFYRAGTNIPIVVDPIVKFSDIDGDQVVGGAINNQYTIQSDSVIEYNTLDDNIYFSYEGRANGPERDKWVLMEMDNVSSFKFSWGMNKLDPDGSNTRVGGYTAIDIRLRGTAGKLDVKKVDEEGKPLEGAEFTVYNSAGDVDATLTTNASGYAKTSNLELGDYTIVETKAPDGYVLDSTIYNETISTDGELVTINSGEAIINRLISGQVELNKVDEIGNSLPGAEFTIYDSDGKEVDTIITDEDGYAISELLDYGEYTITETKAPVGYQIDNTEYPFNIDVDGEIETINDGYGIVNEKIDGQIELNKVDQNGNPLTGVEFTIFDESGTVVEVLTTDNNGYAISSVLPGGEYSVVESKALEGYVLNETLYEVSIIKPGQIIHLNDGSNIVNELIYGQVELNKVDDSDNPLTGVEFTIYDNAGKEVEVLITDEDGYAISSPLQYGSYVIKETKALTGYENSNNTFEFEILNNDEVVQINGGEAIVNELIVDETQSEVIDETQSEVIDETQSELVHEVESENDDYSKLELNDENKIAETGLENRLFKVITLVLSLIILCVIKVKYN